MSLPDFTRARKERKLPVVLSRAEVRLLLEELQGDHRLSAQLMYGSGLRLMEVCRLRVKDIDFDKQSIIVREAKGGKQRITTLADGCVPALRRQVELVRVYWNEDREVEVWDGVFLPFALVRRRQPAQRFDRVSHLLHAANPETNSPGRPSI